MKQILKEKIDSIESRLKEIQNIELNPKENLHLLNSLIQIKCAYYKIAHYYIYQDIKKLIFAYCATTQMDKYGYDKIDLNKILKISKKLPVEERLSILIYTRHQLLTINDLETSRELEHWIKKTEYNVLLKKKHISSIPRILILFPTLSVKHLLFSFFLIFFILSITLTTSQHNYMETFSFTKVDYINSHWPNHFLNVLSLLFKLDSRVSATPVTPIGIIIAIISKSLLAIFVINYLMKVIVKRLRLEA